jgi:hypothetical protein
MSSQVFAPLFLPLTASSSSSSSRFPDTIKFIQLSPQVCYDIIIIIISRPLPLLLWLLLLLLLLPELLLFHQQVIQVIVPTT